ncbi:MAG: hypothetical protein ACJ8CR_25465, partial [Roseiflexaceae bacterium]
PVAPLPLSLLSASQIVVRGWLWAGAGELASCASAIACAKVIARPSAHAAANVASSSRARAAVTLR